jgi:hypothetical protein
LSPRPGQIAAPSAPSPTLAASWIGSTAHSRLEEGGKGTVIGVFDRAVNITLPRGLVCLVTEEVERGPLNITVRLPAEIPAMSSLGLRSGDGVGLHPQSLAIGDRVRVSFASARVYSPSRRLTRRVLEDEGIAENLEVMRKTALLFGRMNGLGGLLALMRTPDRPRPKKLNIFASAALPRLARLEEAFRLEDEILLKDAVSGLIGLGPGLTPSSDDALAGMVLLCSLYSENLASAKRPARLLSEATAAVAGGRTSRLSEEYLREAAFGRGNEPVSTLCEALLAGGAESVERQTRRVLEIGETSGTDAVLGIVIGMMLCTSGRTGLPRKEPL